jgi:hypothetical protein
MAMLHKILDRLVVASQIRKPSFMVCKIHIAGFFWTVAKQVVTVCLQ